MESRTGSSSQRSGTETAAAPADARPTLGLDQALTLALARRPDLFDRPGLAPSERLAQRREALAPWVNAQTRLVPADRWLSFAQGGEIPFEMGGLHLRLIDTSGAHSEGDIMLAVDEDHMLFAGDLFFTGRIPFVGDADSKVWLTALDHMLTLHPQVVVPGHGEMSRAPLDDIRLTQDYLLFLRDKMGAAVADMVPFEEAYAQTDWGRFAAYPAFEAANRLNAYDTYILMERESLQAK